MARGGGFTARSTIYTLQVAYEVLRGTIPLAESVSLAINEPLGPTVQILKEENKGFQLRTSKTIRSTYHLSGGRCDAICGHHEGLKLVFSMSGHFEILEKSFCAARF